MLRAILNNSWRQHPTKHQLYGHLPPITKPIQVRRTRHAGHCWRNRDKLISDVLLCTPTYGQEQDDQLEHTYSTYVRVWDVAMKTCRRRWTIGRSGERGSGISVPAARHDDDDDYIYIYIYIYSKDSRKIALYSILSVAGCFYIYIYIYMCVCVCEVGKKNLLL